MVFVLSELVRRRKRITAPTETSRDRHEGDWSGWFLVSKIFEIRKSWDSEKGKGCAARARMTTAVGRELAGHTVVRAQQLGSVLGGEERGATQFQVPSGPLHMPLPAVWPEWMDKLKQFMPYVMQRLQARWHRRRQVERVPSSRKGHVPNTGFPLASPGVPARDSWWTASLKPKSDVMS